MIEIEKHDSSADLTLETIMGIVAGCVGFCILVMLALIWYRNTRKYI